MYRTRSTRAWLPNVPPYEQRKVRPKGSQNTLKIAVDSWVLASRLRQQGTYVYAQNLISQFKDIATRDPEINFCLFASPQAANDAYQITSGRGFELSMTDLLARE